MLGILFGTMCAIALVGVLRPLGRGFHGHPHHGCHGRGHHARWERHGGGRGGGRGRRGGRGASRAAAEMFKRELDLDEDQSDLVDHALRDLRRAGEDLGVALKDSRSDLAKAFAGDHVDDATLTAIFASQDEDLVRFRRSAVSALKQIHAVLEPDQREQAVGWLSRAGGVWA